MVGTRFLRNAKFLKQIRHARSTKRRLKLINDANPNQIFAIMDAANNILNGNFHISDAQRNKLVRHREHIRRLGRARTDSRARRIIQMGGGAFLPALLAPVLVQLAPYLIKKLIKTVKE